MSASDTDSIIRQGMEKLRIPCGKSAYRGRIAVAGAERLTGLFAGYMKELLLFNNKFGLVGAKTDTQAGAEEIAVRHLLDCLAPWEAIADELCRRFPARDFSAAPIRIADAGSGAGLPGVPLAFLFPEVEFVLVERMEKRCAFLQNCKALLGIKNLSITNSEIENASDTDADAVVFRAFRPLEKKTLRALLNLLAEKDGRATPARAGFLAAYKGKASSIAEETKKMHDDGFSGTVTPVKISVPFLDEERHIVFISP